MLNLDNVSVPKGFLLDFLESILIDSLTGMLVVH